LEGWEGFKNRDKSEDLPDNYMRSKLSGKKAQNQYLIPTFLSLQQRMIVEITY
jgi:hypothetical protein